MIRWINEKLGTAPALDTAITDDVAVLDVRDLVDKFGNSPAATREKIEQGVALLTQGKTLVVCCDYGISRSNAIAAGILSCFSDITLNNAIKEVIKATGEQEIKLEPLEVVRAALSAGDLSSSDDSLRILVTGGSGFIGENLVKKLSKKHYVIAPARNEVDLIAGALELDLIVKEHRINYIVHLANPRVYTSNRAMGEMITLLRNVLEVCKANKVRLLYPSSWEVYSAYSANDLYAGENLPRFPKGPYGEAKMLCENLIEHHQTLHGLECALLRSSPLYGEDSDRPKFIYNFINKALRSEAIKTHRYINGEPTLDLLHVDDFILALLAAIESRFVGTLNIGSGNSTSTRAIAEWIVRKTKTHSSIEHKAIDDYAPNIRMNTSLAKSKIGWAPSVAWEDGLARLLDTGKYK